MNRFEWIDFSKLREHWELNSNLTVVFWPPFYTISGSFNVFLEDDSETTTLVRGIHGLLELVFSLSINKYLCQSLCVYLSRLPVCVLMGIVDKPSAWQPCYFFILALVRHFLLLSFTNLFEITSNDFTCIILLTTHAILEGVRHLDHTWKVGNYVLLL